MDQWAELEKKYSTGNQQAAAPVDDPWAALEKQYALPSAQGSNAPLKEITQPNKMPPLKNAQPLSRMDKFKQGLVDPINAGAQLLTKALPDNVVNAGNEFNNWLADKTGLVGRLPEGGVDQQVRQQEATYQARRSAGDESGFDAYRLAGNVINPTNLAIATKLPMAATGASLGAKSLIGATGGAMSSLLNPVTEGETSDFWANKGKQAALGSVAGAALPVLSSGLKSVISPAASTNKNLQVLTQEGVKPTIGQTLGGAWNRTEEKLQSVPILGDMITNARGAANQQFETAAHNRALKQIGMELPEGLSGRDAVNFTENALKTKYDEVLNKIGAIKTDQPFNSNVANLQKLVNKELMPKAEKDKFASVIGELASSIDKGGVLTSSSYKTLESNLGSIGRTLNSSQNMYENKLGKAVDQLKVELRDMLKRQAGSNADDLANANAGWANFLRVQNAASKLGAEEGAFSPAQFQNAVKAVDQSKKSGAFARGSALGQDLGDAGTSVLKGKVADSGTTGRALMGLGALGGGFAVNPAIPAGLIGGAAAYTPFMQNLLRASVMNRPQIAQPIGNAIDQIAPASIPYFAGLLNQYAK